MTFGPKPPEGGDWSAAFGHAPVLLAETMEFLAVKPDGLYVDCTLGGGGHARAILGRLGPNGRLLALDVDPEPLEWAGAWGAGDPRLTLERASFGDLAGVLSRLGLGPADGLVADLGLSARQLLGAGRGFSITRDGPLDMRLDPDATLTAHEIVNHYPEYRLADILRRYGEETAARKLARLVVEARERAPINSTHELAAIAERALYRPGPRPRVHPATKTFMALRLAVNGELETLSRFLAQARSCLKTGGVLAVISFHSLEDRMVKLALRGEAPGPDEGGPIAQAWPKSKRGLIRKARTGRALTPGELRAPPDPVRAFRPLRRKSVRPTEAEITANPRSRSAKLRAAEAV
ncbi:MAG: 16S rRNA (cytosine(1402)-N(4))-methyltransferase RsmH [Deltaproteobacteria bacterium]|nr:16S rRNA (cytosine(1402)-N(4))-methyltransferase RsmH [Deltaproteobacteria bacterium]